LARFDHSREGRRDKLRIVFGPLTNGYDCPVAVEVFEGNTGDPKTLPADQEDPRAVRDCARGPGGRSRAAHGGAAAGDLRPVEGLDWITALRAPAIHPGGGALQLSLFDQQDVAETTHPTIPASGSSSGRTGSCPRSAPASAGSYWQRRTASRPRSPPVTQGGKRLRGQACIALRVGKVLGRRKVGKHFTLEIPDTSFRAARDEAAIAREATPDGVYVLRTSVAAGRLPTAEAVRSYKRLAAIERAFRSLKTVDLKVRPIHHRKADRVRARVFLSLLAYNVEWHMRPAWTPMLFDDDDPPAGQAERPSVVAPAQRSPRAKANALTKRTDDEAPVHSFQSLLRHLRTIVKDRMRLKKSVTAIEFDKITTPTPLQQRALDRLGLSPAL
jgi:Transposase DDE domain